MGRACWKGDVKAFNRAADKAEALLKQVATATDQFGNLKYHGSEQGLKEFYQLRAFYARNVKAVNKSRQD
jgi:hypothetical protein